MTNPRRRRSIANCSGPQAREAVAPTQRLAPALALGLLAEDRLPWTRDRSRGWWQHHFAFDDRLWEGACRYEPMLVVDSRWRASQKRMRGRFDLAGAAMWLARHMHCDSFCVLCLVGSHLDGARTATRIRASTNTLPSGENAVVTSGVDAALCVKE